MTLRWTDHPAELHGQGLADHGEPLLNNQLDTVWPAE